VKRHYDDVNVRVHTDRRGDGFTKIPNSVNRDKNLKVSHIGVLCKLLGRPPNWVFNDKVMADLCGLNIQTYQAAIKHLIKHGYVVKIYSRGERGRWAKADMHVFAYPEDAADFLAEHGLVKEEDTVNDSTVHEESVNGETPTNHKEGSQEEESKKELPPLQSPVGERECEPSFEEVAAMEQDGDEPLTLSVGTDVPAARMSKAEFRKLADKMGFVVQPRRKVDPAVVEHIYSLYPLKKKRGAALPKIAAALQEVEAEVLIEAVTAFAAAWKDAPASERDFIPHASSWFFGKQWTDDRTTWGPKTRHGSAATTRKFRAPDGKYLDSADDVQSYVWHNAGFDHHLWTFPENIRDKYRDIQ
jgi:hypothetical protein